MIWLSVRIPGVDTNPCFALGLRCIEKKLKLNIVLVTQMIQEFGRVYILGRIINRYSEGTKTLRISSPRLAISLQLLKATTTLIVRQGSAAGDILGDRFVAFQWDDGTRGKSMEFDAH